MNAKQEAEKYCKDLEHFYPNHEEPMNAVKHIRILLKELEQVELNYKQLEKAHAKDILKLEATERKLAEANEVIYQIKIKEDSYGTEQETLSEIFLLCEKALSDYEASKG